MARLEDVLSQLALDLGRLGQRWALVGGLAVSVRTEPRTTLDVDVAVAVEDDRCAERLIRDLAARGYKVEVILEHDRMNRLATARLVAPGRGFGSVMVDILFASSGIEPEVVRAAEALEVLPGTKVPVAAIGHLLALKILAGRAKDRADIEALLAWATDEDLTEARHLLGLIEYRGFARGLDLEALAAELLGTEPP